MITIEVKQGTNTFRGINSIPEEVVIHAHSALSELERVLSDIKTPERLAMGGGTSGVTNGVFFSLNIVNINPEKFEVFINTYSNFLYANFKAKPLEYSSGYEQTLKNMKWAVIKGSFGKDSESFKQTCKALGIKHTYKAIDEFLERVK